jgi:hypothetical protein
MIQGYVVRGLLSVFLSRGPEMIVSEINQRWPGAVQISDHGSAIAWFSNVPWLIARSREIVKSGKKLVLIGHSFGGTAVIEATQALAKEGLAVDLLCPIDPAWQYTTAIPKNVKRVIGFYQHTPGQLGQGEIRQGTGWVKQEWHDDAIDYHCYLTHLQIVADPFVHKTIINEIAKIA